MVVDTIGIGIGMSDGEPLGPGELGDISRMSLHIFFRKGCPMSRTLKRLLALAACFISYRSRTPMFTMNECYGSVGSTK